MIADETPEFAERYGPWAVIAGGSEGVGAEFARGQAALDQVAAVARASSRPSPGRAETIHYHRDKER